MIPLFKVGMSESAEDAVAEVLRSGYIGQGPRVEAFEKALEQELGAEVLTVSSGTAALDLALYLCGVGPGDEVITTPMACTASSGAIVNRHARIVWADVDPDTGSIDPLSVARLVTRRTKAILAVDWGGLPCNYVHLAQLGFPIIEDAAHAYLAVADGAPIARGPADYVCWSFQAIKHLTTGDGGAIRVPPAQLERARRLRWFGLDRRSKASFRCEQTIDEAGFKYHMNDIAAAIGLANIEFARTSVFRHRENAAWYCSAFYGCRRQVRPPEDNQWPSWWLYTLLVDDRPGFIAYMAERGIETSPVHSRNDRHPAFQGHSASLLGTDAFSSRNVAIPVGWWLTEADRKRVALAVMNWARR